MWFNNVPFAFLGWLCVVDGGGIVHGHSLLTFLYSILFEAHGSTYIWLEPPLDAVVKF